MSFVWCAITLMVAGIFSNYLGELLPRRWFRAEAFPYRSFSWEQEGKIYRKLYIHRWKDIVPDMSRVNPGMVSKHLGRLPSSEQVSCLVSETCIAEFVHWVLIVFAHLILLIEEWWATLVLYLYVLVFNLPFILIQRYNRPQLIRLAERLKDREERLSR